MRPAADEGASSSALVTATLSSFHTAKPEQNAFTVYGIAVRKGASNWQVFRRYREWEDLRMRLLQELGSAPPMPPKMLFGRMRPEVIENRVLGLNHFLQLCLNTHMFASHPVLHDFLERNKNVPPEGLDLALLDTPLEGGASGIMDGTPQGLRQQQLKDLVESASQERCWH